MQLFVNYHITTYNYLSINMSHVPNTHWDTPHKAALQAQAKLVETEALYDINGKPFTRSRLFTQQRVPPTSGYRITNSDDPRRLGHSEIRKETRGRKSHFTKRDERAVEFVLWREGYKGRVLSWDALALEAGVDASGRTVRRHLRQKDYRRCLACQRSWVAPALAETRVRFACEMLAKYPTLTHWRNVRFSDEVHLGYGPSGRAWVTRTPGEQCCPACVQQKEIPDEEDKARVHCWATIGYDYKSPLYRYNVDNATGKMTHKAYIELLEQECVSWPSHAVLEEDGDSGHGRSKSNPVRTWKEAHQLRHYFNCPYSPDLAPIENAWRAPKGNLRKVAHWDEETVYRVAKEGWDRLKQQTINSWIDSMPARLQAVIDAKGQMTAY